MNDYRVIFDRLKSYFNVESDRKVAERLGLNYNTIKTWSNRKKVPLNKLIDLLQNETISLDWLIKGISQSRNNTQIKENNKVEVSFYPEVYASAGFGALNHDYEPQKVLLDKLFLQTLNIQNVKNIEIIRVYGDSMEPYFSNGEFVIIERISDISQVKNGNIVVANIDGDIYIKKLLKDPMSKTITLTSTNDFYEPITVDTNISVQILAIVRGKYRPL